MNIEQLYSLYKQSYKVSTDTRSIKKNGLFFALKGANFNGNEFAEEALNQGASFAIIDEVAYKKSEKYVLMDDVLIALQQLANFHRKQLAIPIISLTGSNGKTTSKELINTVLSQKFNTSATLGNLNNHIGVPLTLLAMTPETELGIVEMGANHQKEISFLCSIAAPDYGYITNFGKAHLEGFGGVEGVIKGKSELYDYLRTNNKTAFVNASDALQLEKSKGIEQFTFGPRDAHYPIQLKSCDPFVVAISNENEIKSNLIGSYNFSNIAAAIAIGSYFNIDEKRIKEAIESYVPSNNRSQIITKGTNKIILDAYNANPSSMEVAIINLENLSASHSIAILGDMFELGKDAKTEHQRIADLAARVNVDEVFLIGENFAKSSVDREHVFQYRCYNDFQKVLEQKKIENTTMLIKASRGMALERVVEFI